MKQIFIPSLFKSSKPNGNPDFSSILVLFLALLLKLWPEILTASESLTEVIYPEQDFEVLRVVKTLVCKIFQIAFANFLQSYFRNNENLNKF